MQIILRVLAIMLLAGLGQWAPAADAPAQTFIRFKPLNADGVYAGMSMRLHRAPWSAQYPDLPRAGRNYARFRVARDAYSPWAEVAPDWGTITLAFSQDAPLQATRVEIQLAAAADEKAVFKTMMIEETGHLVSLVLPPDFRAKPDGIVTLRQNAEAHLRFAKDAAGPQGPPRSQFPFYTGGAGGFGSLYADPAIARTELQALKTVGINGLGYPGSAEYLDAVDAVGFDHFMIHGDAPASATVAAQKALSAAAYAKIRINALHDEPGNAGLGMLDGLPVAQFHDYLEKQGLTPAAFGMETWDTITPIKNAADAKQVMEEWGARRGKSANMRYYWTMRYAQDLTMDWFREGTARVEAAYGPQVPSWVNFTDHPLILGTGMYPGPDWFKTGLTRATTMMWTEDWMYQSINSWGNGLVQRVGFLTDILRAAASKHNQPIGFYNTFDDEAGMRLKTLCGIGHGVKAVYFWDYGPTYAATENYWSDAPSTFAGVAQVVREVSSCDDLILAGQPPQASVAIVYAASGEIWDASWALSTERQLLHIALEQEQYAIDLLNEDLLLDRNLGQYQVIYLADKQVPTACLQALQRWVNTGGTLVLLPEAGTRDEYDRPARVLGATTYESMTGTGERFTVSLPGIRPEEQDLPVVREFRACMWRADGTPNLIVTSPTVDVPPIQVYPTGKGRLVLYGFMPGNSFFRQIAESNKEGVVKAFPAGARTLITWPCRLANVARRVTVSTPAVGAYLLESPQGAALILLNYAREPIAQLTVQVKLDGVRAVTSHRQGKLKAESINGVVTLTLPLGLTDTVAFRR